MVVCQKRVVGAQVVVLVLVRAQDTVGAQGVGCRKWIGFGDGTR